MGDLAVQHGFFTTEQTPTLFSLASSGECLLVSDADEVRTSSWGGGGRLLDEGDTAVRHSLTRGAACIITVNCWEKDRSAISPNARLPLTPSPYLTMPCCTFYQACFQLSCLAHP